MSRISQSDVHTQLPNSPAFEVIGTRELLADLVPPQGGVFDKYKAEISSKKSSFAAMMGSPKNRMISGKASDAVVTKTKAHEFAQELQSPKFKQEFRKNLSDLFKEFNKIHAEVIEKYPHINYVKRLNRHVDGILSSPNSVPHDITIVASQVLSFVVRKLIAHPGDSAHEVVATKVIAALFSADSIASYFQNTNTPIFKGDAKSEEIVENIKRLVKNIPIHKVKNQLSKLTVDELYLCAGVECIKAKKPESAPYESKGARVNHHSHGFNNYHLNFIRKEGLRWQAAMARKLDITNTVVSPIPHSILVDGQTKDAHPECCGDEDVNGEVAVSPMKVHAHAHAPGYYEDLDISTVQFASYDALLIDAYNKLEPDDKKILTIAATGIEMDIKTEPERKARLGKIETAAANFALNYAQAKIAIGSPNIMVVFGELTGNKTQVKQFMPGLGGPKRFVLDVADIQKAIFKGAGNGIRLAIQSTEADINANPKNLVKNQIKAQVRIIFHSDTEQVDDSLEIKHSGVQGFVKQPKIENIHEYAAKVDKALLKSEDEGGAQIEYVLQVAHLLGVTPRNFKQDRTDDIYKFFSEVKKFKNLRVITDTSWLTAAARNANYGMGQFLVGSSADENIKEIGKSMMLADRISNDGFMFFSAGERYFKKKIDEELRDGTVVSDEEMFGVAVMRAALEKTSQSYHQEIGGIFELIKKDGVADKLIDAIEVREKSAPVQEGNFIGMMLKLYDAHDKNGLQDAVPFVWGADDLTQYAERSGVEKHKLYRDQFICGAVMEMLIAHLSPQKKDQKEKLVNILRQMRMGADRDQVYWNSANEKLNEISKEGISNSEGVAKFDVLPDVAIRAANAIVQLGKDPVGVETAPYAPIR